MSALSFKDQERRRVAFTAELQAEHGRFMTLNEVVTATASSRRTIGRAIDSGELPGYRVGRARSLRFRPEDVAALMVPIN